MPPAAADPSRGGLREVAGLFLRLGVVAFGGPAAHIAMMHDELVARRRWLTDEQFLDLLGVTNLIPGPNSTEMAIHLGMLRAGWRGLVAAGVLFILPAFLIVLALAAAYVEWGTTPTADALLYGIKPVIIAVILQAVWRLGRTAVRPAPWLLLPGVAVAALYLAGVNELVLLLAGGIAIAVLRHGVRMAGTAAALLPGILPGGPLLAAGTRAASDYSAMTLFLEFLRIGAILYGSGYVLVAFLQSTFVTDLGWLTEQELIDAIAIGQVTPGPVFTTATFIGYVVGSVPGAILATVGIFLPSFLYVGAIHRLIPRLREWPFVAALVDGVNIAALGLMGGVMVEIARSALIDPLTVMLGAAAAVALLFTKVNTTWIIVVGGGAGIIWRTVT